MCDISTHVDIIMDVTRLLLLTAAGAEGDAGRAELQNRKSAHEQSNSLVPSVSTRFALLSTYFHLKFTLEQN